MSAVASSTVNFLPDCACTWLMNAPSWLHAVLTLPFAMFCRMVCRRLALDWKPASTAAEMRFVTICCGLRTVTVKLAVPVFCRVSLAEHCTIVDATGKIDPDGGVQVTGRTPSTRSVAVAENVTGAPARLVAFATRLPG